MVHGYTALELARAAGFAIRRVPRGGVVLREYAFGRVLELGPDATDREIERRALRFLRLPRYVRATPRVALARAI